MLSLKWFPNHFSGSQDSFSSLTTAVVLVSKVFEIYFGLAARVSVPLGFGFFQLTKSKTCHTNQVLSRDFVFLSSKSLIHFKIIGNFVF